MEFSLTYCVSLGSVTICLHAINDRAVGRAGSGYRGGWSLELHCEIPHLGAFGHEAMNLAFTRVEPPAQLHQWPSLPPCLTDLAHSMLLDYVWNLPRVFLPWLCFFSLFLCFLFFLTHYVATFPSCVLCVLCLCFSFIFTLPWAPSSPSLFAASPCPLPVSLGHLILPQPSCHLQAGAVWWSRA